jgi:hypothetical protein
MNKWVWGILAGGLVILLAWLFLPALPFGHKASVAQIFADPQGGIAPLTIQLISMGENPEEEGLRREWAVDGTVISDKSFLRHRLETSGQHTITLKVTDRWGRSSTDAVTVSLAERFVLTWSVAGPMPNMHCVVINEPLDPDFWADNNLCTPRDVGLQWSSAGPIAGLRCTQITDPREPEAHGWTDNYLCVPDSFPFELHWSTAGKMKGMKCVRIEEPADHDGWKNNWLCYSRKSQGEGQKPADASQP